MSGTYLVAGLLVLVALLIATRRRAPKAGSRDHTAHHGEFRKFVREHDRTKGPDSSLGKDFWKSRNVRYCTESAPFVDQKNATGLDAALADDEHGKYGEAATSAIVARTAADDHRRHFLLQNVYIPTHAGYTEIDTVLLHETGIYVFETKNISGTISGSIELRDWTQIIGDRVSHTLYNPVFQNMGHMGALLRHLHVPLETAHIYSFVVFSDRCTLRLVPVSGDFGNGDDCWCVVHLGQLKENLHECLRHRKSVYSPKQLESWRKALNSCVNVKNQVKEIHRAQVQKMHS